MNNQVIFHGLFIADASLPEACGGFLGSAPAELRSEGRFAIARCGWLAGVGWEDCCVLPRGDGLSACK